MARMLNIIPESADVYCDGWFMVFDATFNNISVILWRSVLLVEETGVPPPQEKPQACRKSLRNLIK
jgi:hypothetical protein